MCFSLVWFEQILIWIVIITAVLALLRLIAAAVLGVPFWPLVGWPPTAQPAGGIAGFVIAALNIVVWAFVAIALIYFVFMLISCFALDDGRLSGAVAAPLKVADLLDHGVEVLEIIFIVVGLHRVAQCNPAGHLLGRDDVERPVGVHADAEGVLSIGRTIIWVFFLAAHVPSRSTSVMWTVIFPPGAPSTFVTLKNVCAR